MADAALLDIVPVDALHVRVGLGTPVAVPPEVLRRPFQDWQTDNDDAPVLRYFYRELRPLRHLEFSTGAGAGVRHCLEACDATVWSIVGPESESARDTADALPPRHGGPEPSSLRLRYAGLSHRLCEVHCEDREWDDSAYPPEFFDSAAIDSGHSSERMMIDTAKALSAVKPGGLIVWRNFCPDPAAFGVFSTVVDVVDVLTRHWAEVGGRVKDVFWVRPSFLLVAIR